MSAREVRKAIAQDPDPGRRDTRALFFRELMSQTDVRTFRRNTRRLAFISPCSDVQVPQNTVTEQVFDVTEGSGPSSLGLVVARRGVDIAGAVPRFGKECAP